jgi:hypothetical protein
MSYIPIPAPEKKLIYSVDYINEILFVEKFGFFLLEKIYFISILYYKCDFPNNIIFFYINDKKIIGKNGDEEIFKTQYNNIKKIILDN